MDWFRKKKSTRKKFAGATLQQDQFNFVFFNPEWKGSSEKNKATSDKNNNFLEEKYERHKKRGKEDIASLRLLASSHTEVPSSSRRPSFSQQLSATFPQTPNRNNKDQNAFNFSDQILRKIIDSNENSPANGNKSVSHDTSDDHRPERVSSFKRIKNVFRRSFSNFSRRQSKTKSQLFDGSFETDNIQHRKSLENFSNKEQNKSKKTPIEKPQRLSQSLESIPSMSEEEEMMSKRVYSVIIGEREDEKISKPNRNSLYDNLPMKLQPLQRFERSPQHEHLYKQTDNQQHKQPYNKQHQQRSEYVVFKNEKKNPNFKFNTQKYIIKKPPEDLIETTFPHDSPQVSPDIYSTQLTNSFDNYFCPTNEEFFECDNNENKNNDSFPIDTADPNDNYCFDLMISPEFQHDHSNVIKDKDYFKKHIDSNSNEINDSFYSQNSFSPSVITPPKLPPKTFRSRSLPKKKKITESRWSDPQQRHLPHSPHRAFLLHKIDKPFFNSSTPLTSKHISSARSPPLYNFAEPSFLKCFQLYPKVENVHFDYLPMNNTTKLVF